MAEIPFSTGAIYKGFFWDDIPTSEYIIKDLTPEESQEIERVLSPFWKNLSPHGWYPGIPDRTIWFYEAGIRIVYGGSMGDEVGITGSMHGFFISKDFIELLNHIEYGW
jgi:hypothetical protein